MKDNKETKYNAISYTTTIYKVASIIEPTYERGLNMRQNVNIPFLVKNQQYILRNNNNNRLYGLNGGWLQILWFGFIISSYKYSTKK